MTRRQESACEDPAWLNSPKRAEIEQLLRDIEKEEKERKMEQVTEVLRLIEMQERKEKKQSAKLS